MVFFGVIVEIVGVEVEILRVAVVVEVIVVVEAINVAAALGCHP